MGLTDVVGDEDTTNLLRSSTSRMVSQGAGVNPRARGIGGREPGSLGRSANLQMTRKSVSLSQTLFRESRRYWAQQTLCGGSPERPKRSPGVVTFARDLA